MSCIQSDFGLYFKNSSWFDIASLYGNESGGFRLVDGLKANVHSHERTITV